MAQPFRPKTARYVAKLGLALDEQLHVANANFEVFVREWTELKTEEDGRVYQVVPEDKREAWAVANKEFHDALATVAQKKIDANELEEAKLTPAEYIALEPIFSGFEEMEGAEDGDEKIIS